MRLKVVNFFRKVLGLPILAHWGVVPEPRVRAICRDCGRQFRLPVQGPPSSFHGYAICKACLTICGWGAPPVAKSTEPHAGEIVDPKYRNLNPKYEE